MYTLTHIHTFIHLLLEKTAENQNVEVRIVNVGSRLEKMNYNCRHYHHYHHHHRHYHHH
jgi:predicted PP-loop superfamily ATPase